MLLSGDQRTTDQGTRLARQWRRVLANDIHGDVMPQIFALLFGCSAASVPRPMPPHASLLSHRNWPPSVVPVSSGVGGRSLAGHGSASMSISLPACSSGERSVRVGSGGVYVVSRSMAVREACSTARSRAASRVSRAAMAWRLRLP